VLNTSATLVAIAPHSKGGGLHSGLWHTYSPAHHVIQVQRSCVPSFNTNYTMQSSQISANAFWASQSSEQYIYTADCGRGIEWIFDTDEDCENGYDGYVHSSSPTPPLDASWQFYCNGQWVSVDHIGRTQAPKHGEAMHAPPCRTDTVRSHTRHTCRILRGRLAQARGALCALSHRWQCLRWLTASADGGVVKWIASKVDRYF
jgi:hypothetical protein